jgi:hypothetical protein
MNSNIAHTNNFFDASVIRIVLPLGASAEPVCVIE